MTPMVMATPLTSGGNVSVTTAIFSGRVISIQDPSRVDPASDVALST
jgi:hypothetical protein